MWPTKTSAGDPAVALTLGPSLVKEPGGPDLDREESRCSGDVCGLQWKLSAFVGSCCELVISGFHGENQLLFLTAALRVVLEHLKKAKTGWWIQHVQRSVLSSRITRPQ